jgi:hypothetical protein
LPRLLRFAVIVIALPACSFTVILSLPFLVAGVLVSIWEESA